MATDVERLVVQLSADFKQYQNSLNRAMGVTNRSARQIETRFAAMNRNLNSSFAGVGRGMIAAFAGAAGARAATGLIDGAVKIENALKVTGLAGEELVRVYDSLFASAQRNFAPLETLSTLYSRIGLAQKELGVSTDEMLNFTDKIALALRVQGTTAQEARGALIQLSQALGAGIVRAEEFNSIVEGAPSILRATAAGLKEAGGSVAALRTLVINGEVSSQAFFRAFEAGAQILEGQVASAEVTVSQGFVRLQNVLLDTARELNEGSDASEKMAGALAWLSEAIQETDFSPAISGVIEFAEHLGGVISMIQEYARAAGDLTGASSFGPWVQDQLRQRRQRSGIQDRIDGAFAADPKGDRLTPGQPTQLGTITIKPVSLDDYEAPAKPGRGGGRGTTTKERADEYQRLAERIDKATASLVTETEVQRQLNPLVDDFGYAVEKARTEQDLLNAAKEAGKEVTPQLRSEISALAEQYALATMEAGKLAETQDEIRERAEDMRDFQKDLSRGIVDGFLQGKKAADIFADALNKISGKLLDMAFDGLFAGSGGGGFLGGLFKAIGFANGGYTGPGGKNQPAGVVHKGEVVWSQRDVAAAGGVGAVEAMRLGRAGYANGGPVGMPSLPRLPKSPNAAPMAITYAPTIDARGADTAAVARLEQVIANDRKQFEARVTATVRKLPSNRMGK